MQQADGGNPPRGTGLIQKPLLAHGGEEGNKKVEQKESKRKALQQRVQRDGKAGKRAGRKFPREAIAQE